jgi:hypothetical protein
LKLLTQQELGCGVSDEKRLYLSQVKLIDTELS